MSIRKTSSGDTALFNTAPVKALSSIYNFYFNYFHIPIPFGALDNGAL
jgi:hypothetical protein